MRSWNVALDECYGGFGDGELSDIVYIVRGFEVVEGEREGGVWVRQEVEILE